MRSLLRVSQGYNLGVSRAVVVIWNLVLSSKLIQVVGRIQLLKVVGLTEVLIFLLAIGREFLLAPEGCP